MAATGAMLRDRILRHPVLLVIVVAAAARLWVLASLPLIFTNDSLGYVGWAREYMNGQASSLPTIRTPGYPLFLATAMSILGSGPFAILFFQHLLGVATAAIAAHSVTKRHGHRWGVAVGLVMALYPDILCWECYALTESLAVFLIVGAFALSLNRGGGITRGLGLGATLGLACLVRPSAQVLVPFFAIGWVLQSRPGIGRRLLSATSVLLGLAATTAPWLAHNHSRGVNALADGSATTLWIGMCLSHALDDDFPLPPDIAREYAKLRSGPINDPRVHDFVIALNTASDKEVERTLSRWTRSSIASHPTRYVRGTLGALTHLLQLNTTFDARFTLWRLSVDGLSIRQSAPNMQLSEPDAQFSEFYSPPARGPLARLCAWAAHNRIPGVPQVPLMLCAMASGVWLLIRRNWGEAIAIAGTGAFLVAHAAMLLPWERYSLPAWVCWLMLVPDGVDSFRALARRLRGRGSQVHPAA